MLIRKQSNPLKINDLTGVSTLEYELQVLQRSDNLSGGPAMHTILTSAALIVPAAVLVTAPTVEDAGNRSILYWVVIPPMLFGLVAVGTHIVAF